MTDTVDEQPTPIREYTYNWENPREAPSLLEESEYTFYSADDKRRRIGGGDGFN